MSEKSFANVPPPRAGQIQEQTSEPARVRLLLDTNVWSRLADHGEQDRFHKFILDSQIEVVIPPATLLEVLNSPHAASRNKIVRLICRSAWRRLPTEARRESEELVAEVRRLRPHWLRPEPDQRLLADLERFWGTRVWRAARDEPAALLAGSARRIVQSEFVLREQREQQAEWRAAGFFRSLDEVARAIRQRRAVPPPGHEADAIAGGWQPGTAIELWRLDNLGVFWHALFTVRRRASRTGEDTTYADWVGAYVDLNLACHDRADFGRMLLYEVDDAAMLRCWLRWAVRYAQHATKIGSGNPVDEQYASYLPDADIFATADRRFARVINTVRSEAPASCAAAAFVDMGSRKSDVTDAIADAIESVRGRNRT